MGSICSKAVEVIPIQNGKGRVRQFNKRNLVSPEPATESFTDTDENALRFNKKKLVSPEPATESFADIDENALRLNKRKLVSPEPATESFTDINENALRERNLDSPDATTEHVNKDIRIVPPEHKKKEIIPDPESFAAIDKHALRAPMEVKASVEKLASYLTIPAKNNLEVIRAFYRWITNNIRYDVDGYFSGTYGSNTSESVLLSGKSVCQGYAELFLDLCRLAKIPCHLVSGFSKGYGYNPEVPLTLESPTDHAWNIVFVNGEWRPVECTWGAGVVSERRQFEKQFQECYFLTDPDLFVLEHFPFMNGDEASSQVYQLLKKPLQLSEFNRGVKISTYSLEWDVKMLSHNQYFIKVDEEEDIFLQGKEPVLQDIICHLKEKTTNKNCDNFTMIRKMEDGKFCVRVRPPSPGKYYLQIYGKINENENTYKSLEDYIIQSFTANASDKPYPKHGGAWGARPNAILYGFDRKIFSYSTFVSNNGEFDISLDVENDTQTSCKLEFADSNKDLNRYVMMSRPPHSVNIKAKFDHIGFYAITLFAGTSNTNRHEYVASFLIENKAPASYYCPFPFYWADAHKHNCIILEPLCGDLIANTRTPLRCIAPSFKRLMVDEKIHTSKKGDLFEIVMEPKEKGMYSVYGSTEDEGRLCALFEFQVV